MLLQKIKENNTFVAEMSADICYTFLIKDTYDGGFLDRKKIYR